MSVAKHPSGRPIRPQRTVGRTIWRVPDEGPVTPRLRTPDRKTSAVGFYVESSMDDRDDD